MARNNRAECSCPDDFLGDARTRCYTECTRHDDCQDNSACVRFKCKDPCREPDPNVCGQGANCEVKNHKPICSCPRGKIVIVKQGYALKNWVDEAYSDVSNNRIVLNNRTE